MFDKNRLQMILGQYKQDFSDHWREEEYKWEAVKTFQKNWDINALDFASMLGKALSKTANLLAAGPSFFPRKMIVDFAKASPEAVREMFFSLYDEKIDIAKRVYCFKSKAKELCAKFGKPTDHDYQNENAISVYLWLRYPDKYYIYKYSVVKAAAIELKSTYSFRLGAYEENLFNCFAFYDDILACVLHDYELRDLLSLQSTRTERLENQLHTIVSDISFYISQNSKPPAIPIGMGRKMAPSTLIMEYAPDISTNQWLSLLHNSEVFTETSLQVVQQFRKYSGMAACKELAERQGISAVFYVATTTQLAKRVAGATGCLIGQRRVTNAKLWSILFTLDRTEDGRWIWRLRNELCDAIDKLGEEGDESEGMGYWWLNANPKIWSFSSIAVGEVQSYTLYNENGHKRRIFQNYLEAKIGDMVIGYESNPTKQVVALCQIVKAQDGEKLYIKKLEGLSSPIDFASLRACPELKNMEFFTNPNGSLFRLEKDEFDFILDMVREENPVLSSVESAYGKTDFLREVFLSEKNYDTLVALLRNKKNIILQGAPGVGKTFVAKRLAYSMMGEVDENRVEFIQFHQNYSYEDFVMGYKPAANAHVR